MILRRHLLAAEGDSVDGATPQLDDAVDAITQAMQDDSKFMSDDINGEISRR